MWIPICVWASVLPSNTATGVKAISWRKKTLCYVCTILSYNCCTIQNQVGSPKRSKRQQLFLYHVLYLSTKNWLTSPDCCGPVFPYHFPILSALHVLARKPPSLHVVCDNVKIHVNHNLSFSQFLIIRLWVARQTDTNRSQVRWTDMTLLVTEMVDWCQMAYCMLFFAQFIKIINYTSRLFL